MSLAMAGLRKVKEAMADVAEGSRNDQSAEGGRSWVEVGTSSCFARKAEGEGRLSPQQEQMQNAVGFNVKAEGRPRHRNDGLDSYARANQVQLSTRKLMPFSKFWKLRKTWVEEGSFANFRCTRTGDTSVRVRIVACYFARDYNCTRQNKDALEFVNPSIFSPILSLLRVCLLSNARRTSRHL
jgi:hypothetical protein